MDAASYELTALGSALLDRTAVAYDLLERVFTSQADFDPAADRREFTILASDYAVAVIGVELARVIAEEAPAVRLTFRKTPTVTEDTGAMLSTVDGLLMPHGIISGLPAVELYRDRWTVVAAAHNPEIGEEITLEQLGILPWVAYQRTYDAPVARQLSMLGVEPQVQISVDSFTLLPALVAGTRRIAMVQGLLAERLSARLDFADRGRGTGLWMAAFFGGEFVCPLILLALKAAVGTLAAAVGLLGAAAAALAVSLFLLGNRSKSQLPAS